MIARYPDTLLRLLTVTLLALLVVSGVAGDKKEMLIDARLIWATNDEKSPNTNHTAVSSDLARKLQKTFKWKHYFLVNRQHTNVTEGTVKSLTMSEHCVVEVKNLGDRRVEVRLLGNGKLVGKCTNPLPEGDDLVLGGEAENDTAWFVILRSSSKDNFKAPKDDPPSSGAAADSPKDKSRSSKEKAGASQGEQKPAAKDRAGTPQEPKPNPPLN